MKLKGKDGQVLYKKLKAKVFAPGNQSHRVLQHRAPAGKAYAEQDISGWLEHLSEIIEKSWPNQEYRMVEIASNSFNFVWVRELPALEVTESLEAATA